MIGFLRLFVIGFVLLTILYFVVAIYARSTRREELENAWEDGGRRGDREAFVAEGMARYEKSLRRKLVWLVYVVPIVGGLAAFYFVNVH